MKQNNSPALRMSDTQAFAAFCNGGAAKLAVRLDKGVSVNAVGDLLPFHSQVPLVVRGKGRITGMRPAAIAEPPTARLHLL